MIFLNVIGKKNNQTSVSKADREIPTQGSTDNAGNGKSSFLHYPFIFTEFPALSVDPRVGLFLCLHQRPMIDYVCPLAATALLYRIK